MPKQRRAQRVANKALFVELVARCRGHHLRIKDIGLGLGVSSQWVGTVVAELRLDPPKFVDRRTLISWLYARDPSLAAKIVRFQKEIRSPTDAV